MKKLFKQITALASVIAAFAGLTALSGVKAAETGNVLDIICEDGYISVKGSFEADDMINEKYKVIVGTYDENDRFTDSWSSDEYTVKSGSNTFAIKTDIKGDDQMVKAFVWTNELCPLCDYAEAEIKSLKVLAIGNSFSDDSMKWLYDIAQSKGYNNIMLANAYIGGCALKTHYNNSVSGSGAYTYRFNNSGNWQSSSGKSLEYCIKAEDWDLITLQQASGSSGMPDTYEPYLTNLIEYVNNTKTNPKAKLAWHMTWAYSQDSTHDEYYKYNNDQMTMYNAIASTTQSKVLGHDELSFVIPTGTTIQNIRSSAIGDSLTRDGFHLDYMLGRYAAGLTWFAAITGESIDDITYVPDASAIPPHYLAAVKEGVNNAINTPYAVTQSNYTDFSPEAIYDLDKYDLIDWEPVGSSYYNSSASSIRNTTSNTSASNLKYFISSKMFAKYELPVGTLIVIDSGYQYRPEGWEALDKVTSPRNDNVSANIVEVTDSWWGVYNYRAFNISAIGSSTDLSDKISEAAAHFRIYVPKDADSVAGFEDFYENMEGAGLQHVDYSALKAVTENTIDDNSTGLSVPEN